MERKNYHRKCEYIPHFTFRQGDAVSTQKKNMRELPLGWVCCLSGRGNRVGDEGKVGSNRCFANRPATGLQSYAHPAWVSNFNRKKKQPPSDGGGGVNVGFPPKNCEKNLILRQKKTQKHSVFGPIWKTLVPLFDASVPAVPGKCSVSGQPAADLGRDPITLHSNNSKHMQFRLTKRREPGESFLE